MKRNMNKRSLNKAPGVLGFFFLVPQPRTFIITSCVSSRLCGDSTPGGVLAHLYELQENLGQRKQQGLRDRNGTDDQLLNGRGRDGSETGESGDGEGRRATADSAGGPLTACGWKDTGGRTEDRLTSNQWWTEGHADRIKKDRLGEDEKDRNKSFGHY